MSASKHSASLAPSVGLLLLRVMVGAVFVFHGSQKLFGWFGGYGLDGTGQWMESIGLPFGTVSAALAGGTELLGGIALAAGFWPRLVAMPLAVTMLVGAFTAHTGFDVQQGGMEYPLTLAVVCVALALVGGGRFVVAPRSAG